MKTISLIFGASMIAIAAYGSPLDAQYGIEPPPSAYSHEPTIPYIVLLASPARMTAACGEPSQPIPPNGCTRIGPDSTNIDPSLFAEESRETAENIKGKEGICVIIIQNGDPIQRHQAIRHEFAHCNGLVHGSDGRGWFTTNGVRVQ